MLPRLPDVLPQAALDAIADLKHALTSDILLRYPNLNAPFEVVSEASLHGTGAVLLQQGQPVAYTSKKFSSAERNNHTGEQELLGVVHALRELRCYLQGSVPK